VKQRKDSKTVESPRSFALGHGQSVIFVDVLQFGLFVAVRVREIGEQLMSSDTKYFSMVVGREEKCVSQHSIAPHF